MRPALLLLATLWLAACDRLDMAAQPRTQDWDRSNFFKDGLSMRHPVPGTVARNEPNQPVPQPAAITAAMLARGQERFVIYCSPCHGRAGDGLGMVVERGFPRPPSFHSPRLRQAKASLFYDTITYGHGAMFSYYDRVPPADRWAIIAYIRALQLSQDADSAALGPEDRAQLDGQP